MSVEVIACPVCGSTNLNPGPQIYSHEYDHNPVIKTDNRGEPLSLPVYRVFVHDTSHCRTCGRDFLPDPYGRRELDADLIEARMAQERAKETP